MKIEENVVYWCKTKKLAKEFLRECKKQKITWCDGHKITDTKWEVFKEDTCYIYNCNIHLAFLEKFSYTNLIYTDLHFGHCKVLKVVEFKGVEQ